MFAALALAVLAAAAPHPPGEGPDRTAEPMVVKALDYCRRVGRGASVERIVKEARRAGWRPVYNADEMGHATIENPREVRMPLWPDVEGADDYESVHLDFYDLEARNGFTTVCGVTVNRGPWSALRFYQLTERFVGKLGGKPDETPGLSEAQVKAMTGGTWVGWTRKGYWQVEYARLGQDDQPWLVIEYSIAAKDPKPAP